MKAEAYPEHYRTYIELLPNDDGLFLLADSSKDLIRSLIVTSNAKAETAYAEGKWTIKEVLQHLIDSERVFSYRALSIARGDTVELPAFDHDTYAQNINSNNRELRAIMEELKRLRLSTIDLFKSIGETGFNRTAIVSGEKISARQMLFILIGHEMHHAKIIKEKYLEVLA